LTAGLAVRAAGRDRNTGLGTAAIWLLVEAAGVRVFAALVAGAAAAALSGLALRVLGACWTLAAAVLAEVAGLAAPAVLVALPDLVGLAGFVAVAGLEVVSGLLGGVVEAAALVPRTRAMASGRTLSTFSIALTNNDFSRY
jgi:hypothetical protein